MTFKKSKFAIAAISTSVLLGTGFAAPASAQTIQGDTEITISLELVDLKTNSSITVTQSPDLGQIVRPEGSRECDYTLLSDGSTDVEAFFNTALPGASPVRTPAGTEECAFTSQVTPPAIDLNCPVGETVNFGGEVTLNGIKAVIDLPGLFNNVACEDGPFGLESQVKVTLDSNAPLGSQTITIPFEVTFQ